MSDLVLLAFLLAAVAGGGDAAPISSGSVGAPAGRVELVALAGEMGLAPDWIDYLALHASGESNFDNLVARGTTIGAPSDVRVHASSTEADAARRSFERNRDLFLGSPWADERYTFGTGGWFAQNPADGLFAFKGSALLPEADPWLVFDPRASIVMIIAQADRLMKRRSFVDDPRFLRLRGGFRSLRTMDDAALLASRRPRYEQAARDAGVDPAILDARPSPLPTTQWARWISFNPWGEA